MTERERQLAELVRWLASEVGLGETVGGWFAYAAEAYGDDYGAATLSACPHPELLRELLATVSA